MSSTATTVEFALVMLVVLGAIGLILAWIVYTSEPVDSEETA